MTTAIYYELDRVSAEAVQQARAVAGPGAAESAATGADWPDATRPPEREPNYRSGGFLDALQPWYRDLLEVLVPAAGQVGQRHDISLAEVAHYELLFDLAAACQRWHVTKIIRQRAKPARLVWVTDRCLPDGELAALCRAARPMQIDVICRHADSGTWAAAAWSSAKSLAGHSLRRGQEIAKAILATRPWVGGHCGVVFTEYFPNNVRATLPIAEVLQSKHGLKVVWLAGRKSVGDELARRGIPHVVLPDQLSAATILRGRLRRKDRQALHEAVHSLSDRQLVGREASGGREYIEHVLSRRLPAAWNHAAYWVEAYVEACTVLRPSVIVSTTYSSPPGRAAALAARKFGGQAVYLQHGLFPDNRAYTCFCHDQLLMWGQANRRFLVGCGIDDNLIRVTGPTIYASLRAADSSATFPHLGQPLKIAYLASRTAGAMVSYAQAESCLLAVIEATRRTAGARLTVKTHPADSTQLTSDILGKHPEISFIRKGDSQEVIAASDLVIVASGTTGLEACAADKPLIVLKTDTSQASPYQPYGAALEVALDGNETAGELVKLIEGLQTQPQRRSALAAGRRRLIDDMLGGVDGNSVDRAATAVGNLFPHATTRDIQLAASR